MSKRSLQDLFQYSFSPIHVVLTTSFTIVNNYKAMHVRTTFWLKLAQFLSHNHPCSPGSMSVFCLCWVSSQWRNVTPVKTVLMARLCLTLLAALPLSLDSKPSLKQFWSAVTWLFRLVCIAPHTAKLKRACYEVSWREVYKWSHQPARSLRGLKGLVQCWLLSSDSHSKHTTSLLL